MKKLIFFALLLSSCTTHRRVITTSSDIENTNISASVTNKVSSNIADSSSSSVSVTDCVERTISSERIIVINNGSDTVSDTQTIRESFSNKHSVKDARKNDKVSTKDTATVSENSFSESNVQTTTKEKETKKTSNSFVQSITKALIVFLVLTVILYFCKNNVRKK